MIQCNLEKQGPSVYKAMIEMQGRQTKRRNKECRLKIYKETELEKREREKKEK